MFNQIVKDTRLQAISFLHPLSIYSKRFWHRFLPKLTPLKIAYLGEATEKLELYC